MMSPARSMSSVTIVIYINVQQYMNMLVANGNGNIQHADLAVLPWV